MNKPVWLGSMKCYRPVPMNQGSCWRVTVFKCMYVFIQAGQCGNQVGYALLKSLYLHINQNNTLTASTQSPSSSSKFSPHCNGNRRLTNLFFRESSKRELSLYARAVCFDTEPKVINNIIQQSEVSCDWKYDIQHSVAYLHGGAGNNWAQGAPSYLSDVN